MKPLNPAIIDNYSFYLEVESHRELKGFAKQHGVSTSNIVNTLIKTS